MPDSNSLVAVIRMWASVAWADEVLDPTESTALRRVIAAAPLTEEERRKAYGFLDFPVGWDDETMGSLSESARRRIYRAACKLAWLVGNDVELPAPQRSMLGRLARALHVSDSDAQQLEAEVVGGAAPVA